MRVLGVRIPIVESFFGIFNVGLGSFIIGWLLVVIGLLGIFIFIEHYRYEHGRGVLYLCVILIDLLVPVTGICLLVGLYAKEKDCVRFSIMLLLVNLLLKILAIILLIIVLSLAVVLLILAWGCLFYFLIVINSQLEIMMENLQESMPQ